MIDLPYSSSSQPNPWFIRIPILMIIGAVVLLSSLLVLIAGVQMAFADRVTPGVWVNNIHIGGMTWTEASAALKQSFTYDEAAVFTFQHDGDFWQMKAGELGIDLDLEQTLEQAFAAGRSGNMLINLAEQASIWLLGRTIAPVVTYDQQVATAALTNIASTINRPAQDAGLSIDGVMVTDTLPVIGQMVDIQATLHQLDNTILRMDTGGEVSLVVDEANPRVMDTQAAAEKAAAALSGPITILAEGPDGLPLGPWHTTPDQIARLLVTVPVEQPDGSIQYDVDINIEAFSSFLENLAPNLMTEAKNGRFHFNMEARQLEVIESSVNGRALDVDETLLRLQSAIFNPDPQARRVPVAFRYVLPAYHNNITATELGITEMISQGTTYYSGSSANRIQNIIEAARRFDGVIIAPGEEFSYNALQGEISPEEGFVEGFIIVGDQTISGVGGGVCQVSTTVYQAAFYAGFPITERWAHGYRVGYYESGEGVGMDAAIYQGNQERGERSLDFRFVNDTPYHLLIETSIYPAEDAVQFRFYSTNPGRQVVKSGPVIRDVTSPPAPRYISNPDLPYGQELWRELPAEGAYVVVNRIILDSSGQELENREFRTQYQPWGAVVEVAPNDPRLAS